MATYTSKWAQRFRKPIAATGIGIRTSATEADASTPTITSGSGAPSASEPAGSIYLRTGGSTTDQVAYVTQDGAGTWAALESGSGNMSLADNESVIWGTGSDFSALFNGTNMLLTAAAGDIIIDAQGATEAIYCDLGTDTSATEWGVRNDSGTVLFKVDGAADVTSVGRITTTDGVASGTAKVVGGRAYSNTAASSAVTNTTTETLFDTSYTMPANTLKAGTVVRIQFSGIATNTNATDTLAIKLYIGGLAGTALITLAATDVADNDAFSGYIELICRTAGTGGTFVASGWSSDFTSASSGAVIVEAVASTAIDTTAAQVIGVGAQWSVASTANSCRLDTLTVEIV